MCAGACVCVCACACGIGEVKREESCVISPAAQGEQLSDSITVLVLALLVQGQGTEMSLQSSLFVAI